MSKSVPPKPAAPVRMSRKQPKTSRPGRRYGTPKELFSDEQLKEIGSIVLIWNQIDTFVDWLTHIALKTPLTLFWDVARRFRGVDAKVEILRLAADRAELLSDDARKCIKTALDGIIEYKRYRDNIAHSVVYDADKGIVHAYKHGTDLAQTLVTMDALTGLYLRLSLLLEELREIDLLYRLNDKAGAYAVYPEERDPLERRRTRDVPIQTAQALRRQKARLSLPPLPEFPAEDKGRSLMEGANHLRSEGADQRRP